MGLTGHVLDVEVALRRCPRPGSPARPQYVPDLETLIASAAARPASWPYTAGLDGLRSARGGRGRGVLSRPLGGADEAAGRAAACGRARSRCRCALPYWALSPFGMRWFNELVLLRYGRGVQRVADASADLLLSARLAARLEQGLRPARLHAVPVRAAASGRPRRVYRKLFQTIAARRRRAVHRRDQGLRRRGPRPAVVPVPGHHLQHRHADRPRAHAGHRRRASTTSSRPRAAASTSPRTPSRAPSTTAPWIRASTASTRSAGAGIRTGRIRSALSVRLLGDAA